MTPKMPINAPKDGLTEEKGEQPDDNIATKKLVSASKSSSAENLLPQKKVSKKAKKGSNKAVTGVSGKVEP